MALQNLYFCQYGCKVFLCFFLIKKLAPSFPWFSFLNLKLMSASLSSSLNGFPYISLKNYEFVGKVCKQSFY